MHCRRPAHSRHQSGCHKFTMELVGIEVDAIAWSSRRLRLLRDATGACHRLRLDSGLSSCVAVYSSRATNKGEQPPRSAHPRIHPLLCRRPTGLLATSALTKPGRCGARPRQPTATPFCAASPLSLPATAPASVLGT